jgi:hypothetical protein
MKYTALSLIAAGLLAVPVFASAPYEQIVTEARKTQQEALELAKVLKSKNADVAAATQMLDRLSQHALEVKNMIDATDTSALDGRQKAEFERMKMASDVMAVFINNKRALLQDAGRNRALLRAKAEGIALRAALVEQSAIKLKG